MNDNEVKVNFIEPNLVEFEIPEALFFELEKMAMSKGLTVAELVSSSLLLTHLGGK